MNTLHIKWIMAAILLCCACKKQTPYDGRPATIGVFNGLDDGAVVYGDYSGTKPTSYTTAQTLDNGTFIRSGFENTSVHATYYISPDTLEKDKPAIDQQLTMEKGKSYSLYLLGSKTTADYLFFEDHFKQYKAEDSLTYVQVVNISNDAPISVNIKGDPNGSLVSSLAYKNVTDFMELSVDSKHLLYEFEFRDASTGELLYTESVPNVPGLVEAQNRLLYKNWALVFKGKRAATDVNAIIVYRNYHQKTY